MFAAINPFNYKCFFSLGCWDGDVATTTTVQEFGIHLPTNASALDKHLPTTELTGTNFIIWNNCTDIVISLVGVFLWLSLA